MINKLKTHLFLKVYIQTCLLNVIRLIFYVLYLCKNTSFTNSDTYYMQSAYAIFESICKF